MTCEQSSPGNYLSRHRGASGPPIAVDDGKDSHAEADQRPDGEQQRYVREVADQPAEAAVEQHACDEIAEDRPACVLRISGHHRPPRSCSLARLITVPRVRRMAFSAAATTRPATLTRPGCMPAR